MTCSGTCPLRTSISRRCTPTWPAAADAEGVLDIAYRTVDTPVGRLLLAATERGLVRLAYASENHDAVLQTLAERIIPRILHAPARPDATAVKLEEYFAGQPARLRRPAGLASNRWVPVHRAASPGQ